MPFRPYVAGYGITSAAGDGAQTLWQRLTSDTFTAPSTETTANGSTRVFRWPDRQGQSTRELLVSQLLKAWRQCRPPWPQQLPTDLGVIFASTKGEIEDHVWQIDKPMPQYDSLQPVLTNFVQQAELKPSLSLCVASACSSSHIALHVAQRWLEQGRCRDVLVLAADSIGPFVIQGFKSLMALSPDHVKPFDANRNGLQLGEAAAVIWLSSHINSYDLQLLGSATISEGFAATRPSDEASGLRLTFKLVQAQSNRTPDSIIAHGTGTPANDLAEDHAIASCYNPDIPVSATKWATGHCMGASGAVDFVIACEALRRQQLPPIKTLKTADPNLRCHFVTDHHDTKELQSLVVSSLGFGGVNAAVQIGRREISLREPQKETPTAIQWQTLHNQLPSLLDSPPPWKNRVDRWYQLDLPAQSLAQLVYEHKSALKKPTLVYLASTGASNHSDRLFAATGASSPAKFVHTLPNVRGSSMLQILAWEVPVVTLQAGVATIVKALHEACATLASDQTSWIVTADGLGNARVLVLGQELENPCGTIVSRQRSTAFATDSHLAQWLRDRSTDPLPVGSSWQIQYGGIDAS